MTRAFDVIVTTLAALLFAQTISAQDPGGGVGNCYQAIFDYVCGTSDCANITCPDMTSGPMCVRGRVNMLKCVPAVGQGQTDCNGTGNHVQVYVLWFNCDGGTYGTNGDWLLYETCEGAHLSGSSCQGS